jgi:molecular chaperone GrpE
MEQEREEVTSASAEEREAMPVEAPDLGAELNRVRSALQEKIAENEALNDRLLRLHAEFENYKKRMARERAEFMKFANEGLILEFLPVLDNLERAVMTARSGADAQAVADGLEIILRLFQTALEKAGVTPIEALQREFDPNLHQAVVQVESPDGRDNIVVEEVRRGYLLEGRVLRPSMVKVSKTAGPGATCQGPRPEEDRPGTRTAADETSQS